MDRYDISDLSENEIAEATAAALTDRDLQRANIEAIYLCSIDSMRDQAIEDVDIYGDQEPF